MAECNTATYSTTKDGYLKSVNRAWRWYGMFDYNMQFGIVKCNKNGECYMNTSTDRNMDKESNYKVLMTNYKEYAVVYNC